MNEQEKTYRTLGNVGGISVAMGIVMIVTGLFSGIMTIINGARIFRQRNKLVF